jgi:hypothetical protein
MSFKITTTYEYRLACKHLSYELEERVRKYLKRKAVEVTVSSDYDDSNHRSLVLNSTQAIDFRVLDFIESSISKWVNQIKETEKQNDKSDYYQVIKFFNTYRLPVVGKRHTHELTALLETIADRYKELQSDLLDGEGNVCYMGDIQSWTKMFNCIKNSRLADAYSVYRSLDTGEREITPECVRDLIQGME